MIPAGHIFESFGELCNIFLERYCESANEIYGIYEIYEIIEHKISRFHLPTAFFAKDTTGTRSGGGRSSIPCKTDGLILAIDVLRSFQEVCLDLAHGFEILGNPGWVHQRRIGFTGLISFPYKISLAWHAVASSQAPGKAAKAATDTVQAASNTVRASFLQQSHISCLVNILILMVDMLLWLLSYFSYIFFHLPSQPSEVLTQKNRVRNHWLASLDFLIESRQFPWGTESGYTSCEVTRQLGEPQVSPSRTWREVSTTFQGGGVSNSQPADVVFQLEVLFGLNFFAWKM